MRKTCSLCFCSVPVRLDRSARLLSLITLMAAALLWAGCANDSVNQLPPTSTESSEAANTDQPAEVSATAPPAAEPSSPTAAAATQPPVATSATDLPAETKPAEVKPAETKPSVTDDLARLPAIPFVQPLSAEEIAAGYVSLFDGHTLSGWQSENDVNWSVAEGAITADSGPVGLLLTPFRLTDFEFRCEFRAEPDTNGGIFIRCGEGDRNPTTDAYEINIAENHPQGFTTGSLVTLKAMNFAAPAGDWHTLTIRAVGREIAIQVNDAAAQVFVDERPEARLSGRLGLQKNAGRVAYRNIVVQPLSLQPLWETDLARWHEVPGSKSRFELDATGTLTITGGPGFLESNETWADFMLTGSFRLADDTINSGIFYRSEQGTEKAPSNGYEMQLHDGMTAGEPTQPANAGSGAIFRRTVARRINSTPGQWNRFLLATDGPGVSAWINGYPVTSWTDERPANSNPRKGSRVTAGYLILQGHDPETNAQLRGLAIQALPVIAAP